MSETVLITGAGGSIGSELARQLSYDESITTLILNDISESALFECWEALKINQLHRNVALKLMPILGSISDSSIKENILNNIDTVNIIYHAAAYKHVGLSMFHPQAYYKNNIDSTWSVISIAEHYEAKVVHISTDKAVNPCNHMGYSKRICEFLYFINNNPIKYKIVRFGNVLNSNGSVIPIFKRQISSGGPVTVTDKKATRFFMSINEAVQLVLKCQNTHADYKINILDMGQPQLIDSLARNLIEQEGFVVTPKKINQNEIEIKYIGLRAGEKLHEELTYGRALPTNISGINYVDEVCEIGASELMYAIEELKAGKFDLLNSIDWERGILTI
jgi:FlaA1/EpsC-like NDP-sugar epimerase